MLTYKTVKYLNKNVLRYIGSVKFQHYLYSNPIFLSRNVKENYNEHF